MAKILVVEDNQAIQTLLSTLLGLEGYDVESVGDGEAALALLGEHPVDLVLCDIMLPGRSGLEVCKHVKSNEATQLTPVVLLTGLADLDHRVKGIDAGADDFLTKPFEQVELLARVRSLLRVKACTDALESAETVLCALAQSIEARDPYTQGHCDRLALFGGALARAVGMDTASVGAVQLAGTVHDIGKIALPDSILLKRGALTSEERAVMQEHPVTGETICRPLRSFRLVLPIIRHHHERLDGSGYPDGIAGDSIPLTARVLQVVDVFDALTTERPYKQAQPLHRALGVLREEADRGWWDRQVVEEFSALLASRLDLRDLVGATQLRTQAA